MDTLISVAIYRCSPMVLKKESLNFRKKYTEYEKSKLYSILIDRFESTSDRCNDVIAWVDIVFVVDHFRIMTHELNKKRYHRNIPKKIFKLNSNYSIINLLGDETNEQLRMSIFEHIEDFKNTKYKKYYIDKNAVVKKLNCTDIISFIK